MDVAVMVARLENAVTVVAVTDAVVI